MAQEDAQDARGDLVERPQGGSGTAWMPGFEVPRARFGLSGQFANHVPFTIVTDLAASRLTDAWVGYERFHFAKMYFGAKTVPFARSAILSSADAALSERSRAVAAMAPFRQVGVTLAGDYKLLGIGWQMGVYNGFDRLPTFHAGLENASGLHGNRLHGLSYVGRLQSAPLGDLGPAVHDIKGGDLRVLVGGGGYLNEGGTTSSQGVSADLHAKLKGAYVLLEFVRDTAEPSEKPTSLNTIPAKITRQAMIGEAGYFRGKLGLAVRAELIDPNTDKEDNDDELWLSACVGWHFVRNLLRFQLQYDHRREQAGVAIANDVLLAKMMLRL
jgi:hypothetical protein